MDTDLTTVQPATTCSFGASEQLGLDLIICHVSRRPCLRAVFFRQLGDSPLAEGCAMLRVDNRGHVQVYHTVDRRLTSRLAQERPRHDGDVRARP